MAWGQARTGAGVEVGPTSGNPLATMVAKMEEGALWACPVSRDCARQNKAGWQGS